MPTMGKIARMLLLVWPELHAVPGLASPEAIVTPQIVPPRPLTPCCGGQTCRPRREARALAGNWTTHLQDRDGGALLMQTLFGLFPFLRKLYADAGYQGPSFRTAVRRALRQVDVEIVKEAGSVRLLAKPE